MHGTDFVGYGLGNFDFAAVGLRRGEDRRRPGHDDRPSRRSLPVRAGRHPRIGRAAARRATAAAAAVDEWNALRPCTGLSA